MRARNEFSGEIGMMTTIGRNTVSGDALKGFVERVEALRSDKKEIADQESAVFAEPKASGFVPGGIRTVLKLRAMKPGDRQEAEAIRDQYLFALGDMATLPLFRQVGLINVDVASRESVTEALKAFVPNGGSITVEAGGLPIRLTRAQDGSVSVTEVTPPKPKAETTASTLPGLKRPPREVPDVDPDGAESLGRAAYRENTPIIANPFPFGDPRRARWDGGWRKESGTDGMGPGD
jgi:uncharacterized protein (UPF0335 family)